MISEMSIEKSVEELKGLLSRGKELVIQVYPFTSKPQELGSKLAELNKWMGELNQTIDSIKSLHKDFERVYNPLQASGKTLVLRTSSEDHEMELESISKVIQLLENLSKIENWTDISSPKDMTELRDDSFVMNKSEDHDINDKIVNFNDGLRRTTSVHSTNAFPREANPPPSQRGWSPWDHPNERKFLPMEVTSTPPKDPL